MPVLLAVIPHPDDESYAFAGTIALATRAGWRCIVHCASSGELGKRHDGGPSSAAAVATVREAELAASCRVLGAEPPYFWRLPDGGLRACPNQRARITALVGRGADAVLAPGADGAYGHPDHTTLHRWVMEGWAAVPGERPALLFAAFPRGLFLPQYAKCAGMMGDPPDPPAGAIGTDTWDLEVDVAAVLEEKLAAVAAHRSQLPGGDPYALFPPGVLAGCLPVERYTFAAGSPPLPTGLRRAFGQGP